MSANHGSNFAASDYEPDGHLGVDVANIGTPAGRLKDLLSDLF